MTHEDAIRTMASERYLLDEMSDEECERFESHFFSCATCADDLRMSRRMQDEMRHASPGASTGSAARPATAGAVIRPARWARFGDRAVALPWAVAASLALAVGYQSMASDPTVRQIVEPQAFSPVMLRAATRGAAPEVPIGQDQSLVALSLDAVVDPGAQALSFDLLGPSGNALLSGRAPVPPSGVPLLLLMPSDRFAGSGPHTLVVRDADRHESVVGEYAFVVSR